MSEMSPIDQSVEQKKDIFMKMMGQAELMDHEPPPPALAPSGPTGGLSLWQMTKEKISSVFEVDRLDVMDWEDACDLSPLNLAELNEQAGAEMCGHPVRDTFWVLYKTEPVILDKLVNLRPLAKVFEQMMQSRQFQSLKLQYEGDLLSCALAAPMLWEAIAKEIPQDFKKMTVSANNATHDLYEATEEFETMGNMIELYAAQGNEEGVVQCRSRYLHAHAHKIASSADLSEVLERLDDLELRGLDEVVGDYAEEMHDDVMNRTKFSREFSMLAGGDGQHIPPEHARLAMLVFRENKMVREMLDHLGWAKRMVRAEWRKGGKNSMELTGYRHHELHPERLAAKEWFNMLSAPPLLRADFARRVAEGTVSHKHLTGGQDKLGRGPLVLVRDESGSMDGSRHTMALALEWALLEQSRKQKRKFISIPFSSAGDFCVWDADKDLDTLHRHLAHFYGGGTEPYLPIIEALKLINKEGLRADILMLTDGHIPIHKESIRDIKKVKEQLQCKIVVILIEEYEDDDPELPPFADKVIKIQDILGDKEKLREAVREIA